ncbi:MAG: hypothetical protein R3F34_00600 [Planctomycetota bacterium]
MNMKSFVSVLAVALAFGLGMLVSKSQGKQGGESASQDPRDLAPPQIVGEIGFSWEGEDWSVDVGSQIHLRGDKPNEALRRGDHLGS